MTGQTVKKSHQFFEVKNGGSCHLEFCHMTHFMMPLIGSVTIPSTLMKIGRMVKNYYYSKSKMAAIDIFIVVIGLSSTSQMCSKSKSLQFDVI